MKRAWLLVVLLLPFTAVADNNIAFRAGPGPQFTCSASAPKHISTRGTVWCNSSDGNKMYYTDPTGASSAVTLATSAPRSLTDGTTITIDLSTGDSFYVTLGGNRTIALSNLVAGSSMMLEVTQDATGSRTLTWPAAIHWAGGSAPTLTTTAGKADVVSCKSFNGTTMICVANTNFTP